MSEITNKFGVLESKLTSLKTEPNVETPPASNPKHPPMAPTCSAPPTHLHPPPSASKQAQTIKQAGPTNQPTPPKLPVTPPSAQPIQIPIDQEYMFQSQKEIESHFGPSPTEGDSSSPISNPSPVGSVLL